MKRKRFTNVEVASVRIAQSINCQNRKKERKKEIKTERNKDRKTERQTDRKINQ